MEYREKVIKCWVGVLVFTYMRIIIKNNYESIKRYIYIYIDIGNEGVCGYGS